MRNDVPLLDIMVNDLNHQAGVYQPGPYWKFRAKTMAKKMKSNGIDNFRSGESGLVGLGYTDSEVTDASVIWETGNWPRRILKKIADNRLMRKYLFSHQIDYTQKFRKEYEDYRSYFIKTTLGSWFHNILSRFEFPESTKAGCDTVIEFEGKQVSKFYIENLARIFNFSDSVDFTKVRSVFEIGGGFGANAHLLMHLFPNIKKYLYLDIPPMLYVGTQYLKEFYPTSVRDYRRTRELSRIAFSEDDEREIIAIAPCQIEQFEDGIDLFWNSCSFQEMPESVVQNYAKFGGKFTANREQNSGLCLVVYPRPADEGVLQTQEIKAIFSPFFDINEIVPTVKTGIEESNAYLFGSRTAV